LFSSPSMTVPPLTRLRARLTLWYAGTFCVILALLGSGLLVSIRNQLSRQLDRSLERAVADVRQARQSAEDPEPSRPARRAGADGRPSPPVAYILGADGGALEPRTVDPWVSAAAIRAARDGFARDERDVPGDTTLHLYAERFTGPDGTPRVVVAVASGVEIEDRYSALIAAFGAAALFAVVLVGVGGWILVRVSSAPVEASIEHMRRFVADAAHELRTPLAVLRSRTEVALQQPRDAATYARTLGAIASDARQLGDIVDDLFVLTRADAGERPLVTQQLSLDDIVLDAASAAKAMADAKGVELGVHEFEEARVDGDAILLRRLVMIVLDNAVKFTPAGGRVSVRVGVEENRPSVIVEDTGIGIAAEHMPRIFDRFYRADASRTQPSSPRERGGAGLGLSIAQWIAGAHGATISVASTPAAGTRVTIQFLRAASRAPVSS
jgi:signal transduction histidine kinase